MDVARHAAVSVGTVSHVLNQTPYVSPKLRERVWRAVRELRYHPNVMARSLRTKQTKTVGMIIPDITNPFFPAVVRGAEDVLQHEGYALIVGNSDNDIRKEERYYYTFRGKRVDGLLLIISPSSQPLEYLREHDAEAIPVVYIDRFYPRLRGDSVLVDNLGGSYQAVSHLLDYGHTRIAIITGPSQLLNARLRLQGYERALAERGIPVEYDLIYEGRFDIQSGFELTKKLLNLSARPSAVFVCNGLMTMGFLRATAECGVRVPRDVSLVSFDDLDWFAHVQPQITAVAQPAYDLGHVAGAVLVKRMQRKLVGRPRRRILHAKLVVRESSRRLDNGTAGETTFGSPGSPIAG